MSIIDLLKTVRGAAEEVITPHPVVFHHVPKCGGTSVGRALRKRYFLSQDTVLPEESFRAFEVFTGRSDREQMLVDVLDLREQMMLYLMFKGVRCISLHVRFSDRAYELFSGHYKFITVLREPVSRFVSHYFWSFGKADAHARIEEDFASFLGTKRARRLGATYVEFFAGLPKEADVTAPESIVAAVRNLARFDVVGRLDDLPHFEDNLRRELGALIRIGHENKARTSAGGREKIEPALLAKVQELCAPDIAVWKSQFCGQAGGRTPPLTAGV